MNCDSEVCIFAHCNTPSLSLATVSAQLIRILHCSGDPRGTTCETQPLSFGMAEIVNIRMARKRAYRARAEHHAAQQRIDHGVSKLGRNQAAADRDKARLTVDQHRIEPGDRR